MFLADLKKLNLGKMHFDVEDEFEEFSFNVKSIIDIGQGWWYAFVELYGDLNKVGYGIIEGYREGAETTWAMHKYKDAKDWFFHCIDRNV